MWVALALSLFFYGKPRVSDKVVLDYAVEWSQYGVYRVLSSVQCLKRTSVSVRPHHADDNYFPIALSNTQNFVKSLQMVDLALKYYEFLIGYPLQGLLNPR